MRSIGLFPLSTLPITMALALASGAVAATPADTAQAAAQQYLEAERTFDVAALEDAITPGFVEISPLGEVDEHDRVLSFYAPDKKSEAPATKVGTFKTRTNDDTAIVTTTVSFTMHGQTRTLTVGMAATRTPTGWKLASAQYTPAVSPTAH